MIYSFLFSIPFCLYLTTLCPTVYLGDCGELLVGAYRLGIPHPPGYPVFATLGKIFTVIVPFGDVGFRVNVLSAVSSSLSTVLIYMLLMSLIKGRTAPFISFSSALCFAFSKTLWNQSVIAEVYALNILLICFLIWYLLTTEINGFRFSLLCGFLSLYGLSFTYHPTNWLLGPVFVIFIATRFKKWANDPISGLLIICSAFVGVSLYIYFPLRSLANPIIDWGNPDTLHKVIRHILRKQYKALGGVRTLDMFLTQIRAYMSYAFSQINPVLCIIAFLGGFVYTLKRKKFSLFLSVFFISVILGVIGFTNYKPTYHQKELVSVFFLPSVIIISVWLGLMLKLLSEWFNEIPVLKNIVLFMVMLFPVFPITSNFLENNHSKNTIAYNSAYDMLTVFPKKAVLFTAGDFTAFPIAYLQMNENYRTDVEIFDDYGSLFRNIYGDNFLELPGNIQPQVRRNAQYQFIKAGRIVYCTLGAEISNWTRVLEPEGLNYRVNPKKVNWNPNQFWKISSVRAFIPTDRFNIFDTATLNILNQYEFGVGEYYFVTNRPKMGLKHYKIACAREKEFEWLPNNMATMLPRRGFKNEVKPFYEKVIELNPWYSQAYLGLANIASKSKDKIEAKKYFLKVIESNPYSAVAHFQLANIYSDERNLRQAKMEYIKALTYNPSYVSAHKNLASVLMELGEKEAALSETIKALELNPNDYQLYFNKGAIEYALGKYQDALASWEKAYKMNPNDPRPKQNYEMLLKKLREKKFK